MRNVGGVTLTDFGKGIVRKGGHDDQDVDGMLILEIAKRAPGLSVEDMQRVFIACMEEYGENALAAVQEGYVKFAEVKAGTRPERENDNA